MIKDKAIGTGSQVTITCEGCNERHTYYKERAQGPTRKYCSKKCGDRALKIKKATKYSKSCEQCADDYITIKRTEKYCSVTCKGNAVYESNKRKCRLCGSDYQAALHKMHCDDCEKVVEERTLKLRKKGYSYKEIGKELGFSIGKAKSVLEGLGIKQMVYELDCPGCNMVFKTTNLQKKFCAENCKTKHNSKHNSNEWACKQCGLTYMTWSEKHYCSNECRHIGEEPIRQAREEAKQLSDLYVRLAKAIDPERHKECKQCNEPIYMSSNYRVFCSTRCNDKHRGELRKVYYNHKCRECGKHYTNTTKNSGGCSSKCSKRYSSRVSGVVRRRRLKENGPIDWEISVERLVKRDNNTCYLCNNQVDMNDYWYDEEGYHVSGNSYGSVDHVIAVANGGTHEFSNVKLAHRLCNSYKSDNEIQEKRQLTLF